MSRRGLADIPQGERMNFDLDKARATSPTNTGFDHAPHSIVAGGILVAFFVIAAIAAISGISWGL